MPTVSSRPAGKQKKQPCRLAAEDEDEGQEPLSKAVPLCDDDKKFKNRPYLEPVRIRAHLNTLAERTSTRGSYAWPRFYAPTESMKVGWTYQKTSVAF
ncbi:unnamed protein product [Didymodactylos carnosus]|uniref:Uncharacterized protein n=1 Tax=Didymodactylos carnosus TaxID=1234261 RepID=A0A815T4S1_9BILA|nr:unnamed protein product [Didymodactylos carnosus]CAF1502930.1 unnamed protein product [Didymodactylos carnosus]CAF4042285.1 unnamed protein product [Didymodactylos carnosus]CAF4364462.1 unnamed protein product [Didymodactylos carnosus]